MSHVCAYSGRLDHPWPQSNMIIGKNKAAAEIRHKILRKMNELDKTKLDEARWENLRVYIKGMAKRASAKHGGLGRR